MKKSEKLDWIEKYLDQSLSEQELQEFNSLLKQDKELIELLNKRIKLQSLWNETKLYEDVKKEISEALPSNKKLISINNLKIFSIAAIIIILVGIGSILLYTGNKNNLTNQRLSDSDNQSLDTLSIDNFKIDKPETKTNYSEVNTNQEIGLIYPNTSEKINNHHELNFKWTFDSNVNSIDTLFIRSIPESNVIFYKQISLKDTIYIMYNNMLTPGRYGWTIGRTNKMKEFIIEKYDD